MFVSSLCSKRGTVILRFKYLFCCKVSCVLLSILLLFAINKSQLIVIFSPCIEYLSYFLSMFTFCFMSCLNIILVVIFVFSLAIRGRGRRRGRVGDIHHSSVRERVGEQSIRPVLGWGWGWARARARAGAGLGLGPSLLGHVFDLNIAFLGQNCGFTTEYVCICV